MKKTFSVRGHNIHSYRESIDASESGKPIGEAFNEGFAPESESKLHFEDDAGIIILQEFQNFLHCLEYGIELLQLMQMTSKQKF